MTVTSYWVFCIELCYISPHDGIAWVGRGTYITQLFGIDLGLQLNRRVGYLSEFCLIWMDSVGVLWVRKGIEVSNITCQNHGGR